MPMDPIFQYILIQARRDALIRSKGKPKYPKIPAPKYPRMLERKYAKYLMQLLAPIAQISNKWTKEEYPNVLEAYRADDSDLHLDATSHQLVLSLMDPLKQAQIGMGLETGEPAEVAMYNTALGVDAFNKARFHLEKKLSLGTVYEPAEPWVQESLLEWTETNRKLVKSLAGESLSRMESMVLEAVQTGQRPESLVPRIFNLNRATGINRAKLIAADQMGKLLSLLTEKRSVAIGMDTYTWETAMDERVRGNPGGKYPNARPSHWGAQGKIGVYGQGDKWMSGGILVPRGSNDPSGSPGQEIRCRCIAASRWEDLLKPIDESLLMDDYVRAEMGLAPWPK